MKKHRIITNDKRMYEALNRLKHADEVDIEPPVNWKVVSVILKNAKDNLSFISTSSSKRLRKTPGFDFDVYLKRIWK